jgi:hypothetical protein
MYCAADGITEKYYWKAIRRITCNVINNSFLCIIIPHNNLKGEMHNLRLTQILRSQTEPRDHLAQLTQAQDDFTVHRLVICKFSRLDR